MNEEESSRNGAATLPTDAIAALNKGDKIEAIKIIRVRRHIGLKESKELVDAYIASQPQLQRKLEEKQAALKRGCLIWVMSLALLAVAVLYYLFFKPA